MTAHNSRLPQPADPVADRRHPALGLPKRAFDLAVSLVLLIILTPLMLLAAVLILATMGRPVFFKQERPGLHGRPFQLIKFRTMSNLRDPQGALLPDGQRLGRLGRFLRSTSIDELPELLNVFRGDMSLVGPRPLLMEYLPLYTPRQARRHEVPPGLTGLAQVRGRNALSWDRKFALDLEYIDNWSFWLDLQILWLTVVTTVRREGVAQEGHATMPPFEGSDSETDRS